MFDNILQYYNLFFIIKFGVLTLLALFVIFLFIVFNKVSSLSRLITQENAAIIKINAFILLVLALSLFLTALVIL